MSENAKNPDLYVLDSLANDIEDLESILRMLNSDTDLGWVKEWGRRFERAEVVESLSRLIKRDLVEVLFLRPDGTSLEQLGRTQLPPGNYDEAYFSMTEKGRLVHKHWDAG